MWKSYFGNLAILQDGLSCLHMKETLESPDIVQLLIDKGANVDNPTDVSYYRFTLLCQPCFQVLPMRK